MFSEDFLLRNGIPPHKNSFVRNYVIWGYYQVHCHVGIHLAVAQALLAAVAPRDLNVFWAGRTDRPISWTMIVGEQGDGKTTGMEMGFELLREAVPERIGMDPGSPQAFMESVQRREHQLVPWSEYGDFLHRSANPRDPQSQTRSLMKKLWDCSYFEVNFRTKSNFRIPNPQVSICAGCTPADLDAYTTAHDWNGGGMSRFAIFRVQREREMEIPPPLDVNFRQRLLETLQYLHEAPVGPCLGMTPGAEQMYQQWRRRAFSDEINPWSRGARVRAPAIVLKTAMLYALDFGAATEGRPWYIDETALRYALVIGDMHLASVTHVTGRLATTEYERWRRVVLDALDSVRPYALTSGELLQKMSERPDLRKLHSVLRTMLEMNDIVEVVSEDGQGETAYGLRGSSGGTRASNNASTPSSEESDGRGRGAEADAFFDA